MLAEPELTLVCAWLEAGNSVQRIPPGISGSLFYTVQRQRGMIGHFKRHGARYVEREALVYIALGLITVAQARIATVWQTLREQGPMNANALELALGVNNAGRQSLEELVKINAGEEVRGRRFFTVRAIGHVAPHWRDYLQDNEQIVAKPRGDRACGPRGGNPSYWNASPRQLRGAA